LNLVEFLGVASGEDPFGVSGGKGGVTLETVSLPVTPVPGPPLLTPLMLIPCNFGSKICLSSDSTISTHSESPAEIN